MPDLLPVRALGALVPVVLAEPYVPWQRGQTFAIITAGYAGCVLALAALARFQNISHLGAHTPRWIESAFLIPVLVFLAVELMVIVWNNAAALRTSRVRLVTAADDERRRLERDLHDGAQQHFVALSVLIQLARTAEHDRYQPLLMEASGLLQTGIAELRRLAHGIYPLRLVSGGLAQALPAVAAHAPVPVQLNLQSLRRYPASVETALYFCCSEAVQNAAKHGGPDTTVTITAHSDDRGLTLTISDTGRGFDPATTGTGLTNMTDRLSAIGGDLVIDTAPGRGTRVTAAIAIPVQPGRSELPGKGGPRLGPDTPSVLSVGRRTEDVRKMRVDAGDGMPASPNHVGAQCDWRIEYVCDATELGRRTPGRDGEGMTGSPIGLPRTGKPALKTPTTTLLPKPKAGQAISTSLP